MALITHAYFDEGDFSKVSLLEDTYHHLNACLTQNNAPLQNFVGELSIFHKKNNVIYECIHVIIIIMF